MISEEASALDEAMRQPERTDEPVGVDLISEAPSKRPLPSMALIDDRTANALTVALTRALRAPVEVSVESGGVTRCDAFQASLDQPGCVNELSLGGLGATGALALQPALAVALLERLLGASQVAASASQGKARYSAIELAVIKRISTLACDALNEAWSAQINLDARYVRTDVKPANVALAKADEALVATTYRVRSEGIDALMHVAIPLASLDAHKDQLGVSADADAGEDSAWGGQQEQLLRNVPVDVVAELGRIDVPLRRLLALAVGDVLRLDQAPEDPVIVRVAGVEKFTARPSVRFGNIAIELDTRVDTTPQANTSERH